MASQPRRSFLKIGTTAIAAGVLQTQLLFKAKAAASERVRVGIMGAGGRALSLIESFSANPSVEVVAIADLDHPAGPRHLRTEQLFYLVAEPVGANERVLRQLRQPCQVGFN